MNVRSIHGRSVYRKYNSFFNLKTKRVLKFFIFRFSISLPTLKKRKIFWNSFFDFKSKNEFENFDFCFLKLVLNQNRLKKDFLPFFIFSFNNQNWKMKDAFWNSFFHFKSKSELRNFNFHFMKSVINQNMKNWKVAKINTDNLSRIITIVYRLKALTYKVDNRCAISFSFW